MSDYKLILIADDNKLKITYRNSGERLFKTIHLKETDFDKVIDQVVSKLEVIED